MKSAPKHTLRKGIAGLVLAGGIFASGVGIASANDGTTTTPAPAATEQVCQRAGNVWERLIKINERLVDRYHKGIEARDAATAAGKTELAAKIDARLERVRHIHEVVVNRLQALHDRAVDRCTLGEMPNTALA
jgi:hypothetical protein